MHDRDLTATPGHERVLGLDLLRSLAIVLVIVSHWANNMGYWYGVTAPRLVFFGGDLGVDLFFALSGFLIGQILLDIAAREPGWRSLRAFMVRRWLRTLPLYFTWLLVLAVWFPPAQGLGAMLLRFATLTQNLWRPMPADYWYAVSWSLTVEEWFYLLFGAAAIAAAAIIRRPWALWLPLAGILVLPPVLRLSSGGFMDFTSGYFKMVPFRLDEIGYGVVFAWLFRRGSWVFRHPLPPLLLGCGLIAAAATGWLPLPFRLFLAFQHDLAVLGCALFIPAAMRLRAAPRWLAAPARYLARLSYALYLVHLTILVDVAQGLWWTHRISTPTAVAIAVIGPFIVAELLSRLIEQPFMRIRPRQFAASTAPAALAQRA